LGGPPGLEEKDMMGTVVGANTYAEYRIGVLEVTPESRRTLRKKRENNKRKGCRKDERKKVAYQKEGK